MNIYTVTQYLWDSVSYESVLQGIYSTMENALDKVGKIDPQKQYWPVPPTEEGLIVFKNFEDYITVKEWQIDQ